MKRLTAAALLLVALVTGAVWFRDRLAPDFWPPDASRLAPNMIAALLGWVVVLLVVSLLYPPLHSWLKSEFAALHDKLDTHHEAHLDALREHHDRLLETLEQRIREHTDGK